MEIERFFSRQVATTLVTKNPLLLTEQTVNPQEVKELSKKDKEFNRLKSEPSNANFYWLMKELLKKKVNAKRTDNLNNQIIVHTYRQYSHLTDGTPTGSRSAINIAVLQHLPGQGVFLETTFRYAKGGLSKYEDIDTHAGIVGDTFDCKPMGDFTYDTIENVREGLLLIHRFYDNPLDKNGFGIGIPDRALHVRQDQLPDIMARSYLVLFNSLARKGGPIQLAPLGFNPTTNKAIKKISQSN